MNQTNRSENPLRDAYLTVLRHKWKASAFFLAVMVTVTTITIAMPRAYQSEGKLLVGLGRENTRLDPTVTLQSDPVVAVPHSRESEINSVVEILNSRRLAELVVDSLGTGMSLGQDKPAPFQEAVARDKAIRQLRKRLSVEPARKSNVVSISYAGRSPEMAQAVVAKLFDVFLDEHIRLNRTDRAHEFFAEETARSLEELTRRQEEFLELKNKVGPTSLDGQRELLVSRVGRIEDELYLTKTASTVSEVRLQLLREKLAALPEIEVTSETSGYNDEGTDRMREQFYALQLREYEVASTYTKDHPKTQAIRQQISDARDVLDAQSPKRYQVTKGPGRMFEQTNLALLTEEPLFESLKAKDGVLRSQLAAARSELKTLNQSDLQIANLQREIDLYEANYRKYTAGLEQSRIDQALQAQRMSNIKIMQPATYEIKPIRPRTLVSLLLGLLVATLGGIGVALVAERFSGPGQIPAEIKEELELPVLDCFATSERNTHHSTEEARAAISPSTDPVEQVYVESL